MRRLATRLEGIDPPEEVVRAHRLLAASFRSFADDANELVRAATGRRSSS